MAGVQHDAQVLDSHVHGAQLAGTQGLRRRALVGAALLTGVTGLVGCGKAVEKNGITPVDGTGGGTATARPPKPPTPPAPLGTPTPADWKALAESLSGKLLRPGDAGYPVAHQLYDPAYDSVLPAAVAECSDPADVATTLKFAERFKLPLTGKSGGHSYVGASTNHGGIVISVRPIAGITFDGTTARVGAGTPLKQVYTDFEAKGRIIPAGSCPTVGVAGLTLGGGLSLGNRAYGMTCDTVTQVQVVTADGKVRIANATSEPELYWACRGGGGGTLGVVTEFWFKTVASPLIGTFSVQWNWPDAAAVVQGWQRYLRTAPDEVWPSLRLTANPSGSQTASVFGVDVANDPGQALDRLISAVGRKPHTHSSTPDRRFGPDPDGPRTVFYAGTDILGTPLTDSGISAVLAAMNTRAHDTRLAATAIFDPLGGAVSRLAVDATAFPWRRSFASIQWYSERGGATGQQAREWIAAGHKAVAGSAVGGYVNYLEASRPSGKLYFGPNLDRLRAAKAKYDPTDVFKLPYAL
ncbi:FAD-binding protein [Actinopolymorpha sp. B17G11]|uniref:FAD-binding oxidoreductase n=1 Tax=Actinopolymorpha sp. B17G11 TaxID=3160861 RepID=UPI0032E4047A